MVIPQGFSFDQPHYSGLLGKLRSDGKEHKILIYDFTNIQVPSQNNSYSLIPYQYTGNPSYQQASTS